MLKSFWKTAWRNMIRHRVFAVINILGLALGICFCLIIFLVVRYEFSFDRFHPDGDRIYRVGRTFSIGGLETWNASRVMPPLPAVIRTGIPGLESVAGFFGDWSPKVTVPGSRNGAGFGDLSTIDRNSWVETLIVNPDYFSIFSYRWLAGNVESLKQPFQVVLAASRARAYFGNIPFDAMIGKPLVFDDSMTMHVSGIVADWNGNSDMVTHEFVSFPTINSSGLRERYSTDYWGDTRGHADIHAFVKLARGMDPEKVRTQLDRLVQANMHFRNGKPEMLLEPLSELHFDLSYSHDDIRKAHRPTLYGVVALAGFILILAVINFINLSTAQSIRRAREVGVRKVLGGGRAGLTLQFLGETLLIVLFAVGLALLLAFPMLKIFSAFIAAGVALTVNAPMLLFLLGMILLTTFLAGFYPARVLSGYLPVVSLRGAAEYQGNQEWMLRRGLIVFQFTLSLVFIICTLVVGKQVRYELRTDYGFKTDAVVSVYTNWKDSLSKEKVFENALAGLPGVAGAVREVTPPIGWGMFFMGFSTGPGDSAITTQMDGGNEEFVPFYGMRMLAGRNLHHTDSLQEILINETAARSFGFATPQKALGKFLYTGGGKRALPIVGVVADYHTASFHDPIRPIVIGHWPEEERFLGIRLATTGKSSTDMQKLLGSVEKAFKSVYPDRDFNYAFMDESIRSMYEDEQKLSLLVRAAMVVTIFISCMGLFGVALFAAEKRTKEVSIRKVLGASLPDLLLLLCKDFVVLVGLSVLIASPVAWWAMSTWLQGFAYRVGLGVPIFVAAGFCGMVIAILTVSFQAFRVANANPVRSLRAE
jgi:putative ABC transport system permease protein